MVGFKTGAALLVVVALTWLLAPYAGAGVITMDFQDIDVHGGPVDATAYLGSHGITLSNVFPAGQSGKVGITNFSYGSGSSWVDTNFLYQDGGGAPPCGYTLNFSTPLESVSFTLIATPPDLSWLPQWSATAYVGTTAVGSVGESFQYVGGGRPAQTYTLSGDGITSLAIGTFGYYFAGIGSVPLDDFVMTTQEEGVPEPTSLAVWALMGVVGPVVGWRRRTRVAQLACNR